MSLRRTAAAIGLFVAVGALAGCQASRSFISPTFRDDRWNVFTTPHFVIHVRPGSVAEADASTIGPFLESCLRTVNDRLGVRYDSTIHYLLYASQEDKQEHAMVGGNTAGAIFSIETIYAVYYSRSNTFGYGTHEITHMVTYWTIGIPVSTALEEGTAVYLSGGHNGQPAHAGAARFLAQHRLAPLATMFDNAAWNEVPDDLFYLQAGSFVQYVIERFGVDRFKTFYPRASSTEFAPAFQQIYGVSIDEVYANWLRGLETGELR